MLICKMMDVEVNDENYHIPPIPHIWKTVVIISVTDNYYVCTRHYVRS